MHCTVQISHNGIALCIMKHSALEKLAEYVSILQLVVSMIKLHFCQRSNAFKQLLSARKVYCMLMVCVCLSICVCVCLCVHVCRL